MADGQTIRSKHGEIHLGWHWCVSSALFQHLRHLLTGPSYADGILRTIDTEAADRTTSMQSALTDLEALMAQAKEMVDLAQSLNAKLASNGGSESDDTKEATMIKSSLQAMGMVDVAVTPEMARSRQDYAKKLATELDTVLRGRKMLQERGIVGLDEAWCLWNRARGVCESCTISLCALPRSKLT